MSTTEGSATPPGKPDTPAMDAPPRLRTDADDEAAVDAADQFLSGLLETRLAILQKKAESEPIEVPPEVLEYIADLVKENIRQLEGALNRVVAYASLNRVKLTLELAREVLADLLSVGRHVTPSRVLTVTADFFDLTVEDLRSKSRSRPLVNARQQGMFAMRQLTSESFPAIGRHFGNRDHTTVMHAVTKVEGLMREKRAIYDQVHELLNRIRNGG